MISHPEHLPLFVYGTLRPGEKNYPRFLEGRILRTIAADVPGRLYFVADGGYPYITRGEGRVRGDLVFLDPRDYDATLLLIDRLEEYDCRDEAGSVYLRRQTEARSDSGAVHRAWVYYWNCPDIEGVPVESGDFRDRPFGRKAGRGDPTA